MNISQKATLRTIDKLNDHYCVHCLLKEYHRKQYNKNYAHYYCIKKCTVGIEIKRLGNILQ
ncbi:zinc-finger domain-containing protein [Macrococcus armenti]|uniref:zinc-finger domain-containing protein n=1 Tax=Macrococcus armenti TaxID=2875764 RepID=UPI001CC99A2D|nr:zinc-finger domain-containing protein [Macrococcus armenti]UBH07588.1 zinc-finger domain-containing protein [Macrococcus armenti]UBH09821.1 zinc-finger domain-containing protein [Macrococcus armenti]UBH14364.1 zinc-finger domain-containing protein [Macrococcus armenti]UBH16724.1 zinc-finger domain-containing protein [Macrococcus armenti]UBH18987.1 zinc-finger domain-containing protein [Macrococcus armenti]